MRRRTKIIATLGPATSEQKMLDALIDAGVDVVRLNLSHGSHEEHRQRVEMVRQRSKTKGHSVGVLIDLQGPKIRIARFADAAGVELEEGDAFILDSLCSVAGGNAERVGITYPELAADLVPGDVLVLADGAIELAVDKVIDSEICCTVIVGGRLTDNKGINKKGGGLSAPALTEKDRLDICFAAEVEADFLAVSFVRNATDVKEARRLLQEAGGDAYIVAKIERAEALDRMDEILEVSEVVMVARGDLGVEIGDAELPAVQKRLIRQARSANRVVVTATQMMESMIQNPLPTRAEVFDIANAVLDGTDAVMLSAETAAGKYPIKAVKAMGRVCEEAEKQREVTHSHHRLDSVFGRIDEAIAMATMYTANHMGAVAIAAWTESGSTAKWMSRISSGIPIYALTSKQSTRRKVTIFRGVYPVKFISTEDGPQGHNAAIVNKLVSLNAVEDGDLVVLTKGDHEGVQGGTNVMKIICVGLH